MRSAYTATIAAIAVAAATFLAAPAAARHFNSQPSAPPPSCTAETFREFSAAVWDVDNWQRGRPRAPTLWQHRQRLACAPAAHRHAMKMRWRIDGRRYYAFRDARLRKPFLYPSGRWFAVPYPIATCESGENYYVGPSGAYGLIPPFPQWMSPAEQDRVALNLYLEMGEAPWAPYETGCAYR